MLNAAKKQPNTVYYSNDRQQREQHASEPKQKIDNGLFYSVRHEKEWPNVEVTGAARLYRAASGGPQG